MRRRCCVGRLKGRRIVLRIPGRVPGLLGRLLSGPGGRTWWAVILPSR